MLVTKEAAKKKKKEIEIKIQGSIITNFKTHIGSWWHNVVAPNIF